MEKNQSRSFTSTVRRILHEGNIRHLVVRKHDRSLIDLPLTIVVIATVVAPWLVGIGLVAAVIASYTVSVVKEPSAQPASESGPEPFHAGSTGDWEAPAHEGSIDAPE